MVSFAFHVGNKSPSTLHYCAETIAVPKGISVKGRGFLIFIGTSVPETMVSLIIAPLGCKIYLFSPSP